MSQVVEPHVQRMLAPCCYRVWTACCSKDSWSDHQCLLGLSNGAHTHCSFAEDLANPTSDQVIFFLRLLFRPAQRAPGPTAGANLYCWFGVTAAASLQFAQHQASPGQRVSI